ncbi:hypothetical protein ACOMHN_050983 [Nucella lapillus]
MAERGRCVCYLPAAFVLLVLITGADSQCGTGYNRTLRLRASHLGQPPGPASTIVSPGYPGNYPDNTRCRWLVYTNPGYVIHVHVAWIDVERSYMCSYDVINLYDGQTVYHTQIGRICTAQVRDFYSSGNYMYLEFRSDFAVSAKGFQLEYSAIRPSKVPATVTPRNTRFDTTSRTTTSSSSSNSGGYRWPSYSVAALIGGLSGALVLLFVLFALARYYFGRHYRGGGGRRQTARPYPPPTSSSSSPHPPPPPQPSTIYRNNNAVFVVSSASNAHLHPSYGDGGEGGATNFAFSPYGEAPPAYFAVQHSTTVVQPGGGTAVVGVSYGVPPPSYTETMRFSHPPAPPPQPSAPPPPPPPPAPFGAGPPPPSVLLPAATAASSGRRDVPPPPPPPNSPPPPPPPAAELASQ